MTRETEFDAEATFWSRRSPQRSAVLEMGVHARFDVDEAETAAFARTSIGVILDNEHNLVAAVVRGNPDGHRFFRSGDAMVDGIFDKWLKDQHWNLHIHELFGHIDRHAYPGTETKIVDGQRGSL